MKDISYHEPVSNGGTIFMAGFMMASVAIVAFGGIAIVD